MWLDLGTSLHFCQINTFPEIFLYCLMTSLTLYYFMWSLAGYSLAWSHEANSISLSDYIYFSSQLLFSIEEEWQECQDVELWECPSYKPPHPYRRKGSSVPVHGSVSPESSRPILFPLSHAALCTWDKEHWSGRGLYPQPAHGSAFSWQLSTATKFLQTHYFSHNRNWRQSLTTPLDKSAALAGSRYLVVDIFRILHTLNRTTLNSEQENTPKLVYLPFCPFGSLGQSSKWR